MSFLQSVFVSSLNRFSLRLCNRLVSNNGQECGLRKEVIRKISSEHTIGNMLI